MSTNKLIYKNNFILLFFSLLPISFILGNAVLELNIILIIILFLREIIKDKDQLYQFLQGKLFFILLILWAYLNINSLFAINYEGSLRRSIFFFRYIFLIFAVIYFLKNDTIRNKVINFWALVLLIVSIDIFFEFFFGKNILGFESPMKNERIVSFFKDELIVGSYLSTFMFIIVGKFYYERKKSLSIMILLFLLISIIITGERSITLKALLSVPLIIFFVLEKTKLKILILILSIFLTFIALTNKKVSDRYKSTFKHVEKNFESQKLYNGILDIKYLNQSIFSYEILKQNYLLGVGTKNYFIACSGLKNTSKNELIREKAINCYTHPHQFYYEFMSEHGVLGTITILTLILMLFLKDKNIVMDKKKKRKLFIFKIYIIISLLPIIPTGSFFSSLQLFQFFINYSFYQIYLLKK